MIAVYDLTKRFHTGGREILSVDRLSFSVAAGEVFGLIGPNGSGKTTTIRMIVGLLSPDVGFAEVAGFRTSEASDEVKSRIGLVTASDGLYPSLSVREMLLFFADLYGLDPSQARQSASFLSDLLEIRDVLDRRCSTLSTGQYQRANLARALIHDPPVMLLDEPTRGLDVVGTKTVFDFIARLRERGKAVIVCTHRLDEAERLCDRFGILYEGRLHQAGSLADLQAATGRNSLVEMVTDLLPTRSAAGVSAGT